MATCMLVEGEDSLPTKCLMNTPIIVEFGRTMCTYWLPWYHNYLCRVADTRTAKHKTNVNYMYTIPTYVCVGVGRLGYKSINCSYSRLIHHVHTSGRQTAAGMWMGRVLRRYKLETASHRSNYQLTQYKLSIKLMHK